ncbi:MAG TPA: polyprenol monophosphomannose synthase [Candidatus Nanoarchaeia archaeon]|nr:polyprenol monophosphomannose synthase [Candidatus Nanoarchaeia archaeon]
MRTIIVIPTYNEKNNLPELIRRIFSLALPDLSLIIVDDNSPDGTGAIAENLKKESAAVEVIHRAKKMGLGSAYVEGFKLALSAGADYIMEMDADFSHDYRYLPVFLKEIARADLVLGSRYIRGGGIKNWGWGRRAVSGLGNIYARMILGAPIHDLTGGFKCYRRSVLEKINLAELDSQGYVFQIETTYLAWKAGFAVKEIPIIFNEREAGKSKFNFKIFIEALWRVLLLRFKKITDQN